MLMEHFLDDDFDIKYPEMVAGIESDKYYVNMMRAWYFATALAKQYVSVIQRFLALNPDKKVSILICGNDPKLDRSFFVDQLSDCQVIFPDGNPAEDLCALSHCDYLMGAPSTYSLVAAMYRDVPLYWIEDAEAPLTLGSFQHFDTLFRHIY